MRRAVLALFTVIAIFTAASDFCAWAQEQQKINREDRELAQRMLQNIHDALKKNYYDPSFHDVDIDARYKEYDGRLEGAVNLGSAFRIVAAYLSGLKDSHTFFVPPTFHNVPDYGFEIQTFGEACYVTRVRPGSDAEGKINPGDQVLSLDGYAVGRADLWQLRYYLSQIAPRPVTTATVRSPSGETRCDDRHKIRRQAPHRLYGSGNLA